MADADSLMAVSGGGCVLDRREYPGGDVHIGLTPGRPQGIAQVDPVLRLAQRPVSDCEPQPFEVVRGLDKPTVGHDREAELCSDRFCRLHGALEVQVSFSML